MESMQLSSGICYYKQIKEKIKDQITTGELKDADRLPSERELCSIFGVSRITVRQAISDMVKEGLLYTIQGKGTYIAGNIEMKINQGLVKVNSFKDTMQSRNLAAQTKILNNCMQQPDIVLSKILDIDATQRVLNLSLMGMTNQQVIVLYESFFELSLGQRIYERALEKEAEGAAFSSTDLYTYINVKPSYVDQTFEAITANKEIASLMNIMEGQPIFLISSIIYNAEGSPLEYRRAFYRSDHYKFHIKRQI